MIAAFLMPVALMPLALTGCDTALAPASEAAATTAPLELTGRVVDAAGIYPELVRNDLTQQLEALEEDTLAQFVVVSTPSLDGLEIEDYAQSLGNGWGIGHEDRNDGVLLIVAPNDRKVRIEVGLGLEDELPDQLCEEFIQSILVEFRKSDLVAGTQVGVDSIDRELRSKLENQS